MMIVLLGQIKRGLRPYYWRFRMLVETRMIGSACAEWIWRTRHWQKGRAATPSPDEAAHHHRRPQIVAAVSAFDPLNSVLEVGCNTGANLYLLAQAHPHATVNGVDINAHSVRLGQDWFRSHGMPQVSLSVARADALSHIASGSVDVVLSDAVLMFVGPGKIATALSEMRRVARRGVVLHEYASRRPPERNYDGGRFVYDYWTLCAALWPDCDLQSAKSAFQGDGWDQYGWLFVINF